MTQAPAPLSLVVFAYNERDNVGGVLAEIAAWLRGRGAPFELIVVDDGSGDGTADAARAALRDVPEAKILSHDRNRGIGAALKTGVRAATLPWVTFLPADGQIAPGELDALLAAAAERRAEVVFSVYRDRDDGAHRKLLSFGVRALILLLFGVRMASDGPYLFRRELFDPERLKPDTFFLNFEFPIRIARAGAPRAVVAIRCLPRRSGVSKSTGLRRIGGVFADLVSLRARLWVEPPAARTGRGTGASKG